MSAPVTTAPQRRAAPQVSAFMVGAILVIVASISLLTLATLRLNSPDSGAVVETYVQGAGYPLHGGLAGPSRCRNDRHLELRHRLSTPWRPRGAEPAVDRPDAG